MMLTHYDPERPRRLAWDASPVGIGAVLSYIMEDGSERPIVSRILITPRLIKKPYPWFGESRNSIFTCLPSLHTCERSKAPDLNLSSQERNTSNNSCLSATLHFVPSRVRVPDYRIQEHYPTWKCRQIVMPTFEGSL